MKIICFHNPNEENGYLSNWYPSDFSCGGFHYCSMEQYMMHQKAMCFHDERIAEQILGTSDAAQIKALGRAVSGYDDSHWNGVRQIIIFKGLCAKFSQNEELLRLLKSTGIGLSMTDPDRLDRRKWKGQNLLGYALMMTRETLSDSDIAR